MFSKSTLPCLILLLSLLSGCLAQIRDDMDDTKLTINNHYRAKFAYQNSSAMFCNVNCPRAFKSGFFSGYIDMLNGSNGCPPVFAPRPGCCEWMDCCNQEDRTDSWYDGYAQGVLAAQQDGVVDANRLPARLPSQQIITPDMLTPAGPTGIETLPMAPVRGPSSPLDGSVVTPPPTPTPMPEY